MYSWARWAAHAIALGVVLAVAACDGCGCSERVEHRESTDDSPDRGAGSGQSATTAASPTPASVPVEGALAPALAGLQLARSAAADRLEDDRRRVIARAALDGIIIGNGTRIPLEDGYPPESREALRQALEATIRPSVDAHWFALLESPAAPPASESELPVAIAADRRLPAATFFDLWSAIVAAGQPVEVLALGADGWPRLVAAVPEGVRRPWTPVQPTPDEGGEGAQRRVYEVGGDPATAPSPGPDWDDRVVPVQLSVLPAGIWLTAGTADRRLEGFLATGTPRDTNNPNLPAFAPAQPDSTPESWLDWSAVQQRLATLRSRALAYDLEPSIRVSVNEALPVGVLVRALDVVYHGVSGEVLATGDTRFDELLLSGQTTPHFLPVPQLHAIRVQRTPGEEGVGRVPVQHIE